MASLSSSNSESTQNHPEFFRTLLQQQLSLINKKNVGFNFKNQKKSLRWYCQVCGLMLTSKVQAQEHFFGRKHQNVARNKDVFNQEKKSITGQNCADKKGLVVFEGFHGPSKSSFDQSLGTRNEIFDSDDAIPPPAGSDNILETVIRSEKKTFYSSDLSIYRTPSGKYYCQPCNVTVNSQTQFFQHSESRKHKQKVNRMTVKGK